MNDYTPEPIRVSESAVPAQLMSFVRDAALMATAWAVGQGYIDTETGTQITGVVAAIAVIGWRQYVTRRNHKKLVVTAHASPNDIAVVK